MKDSIRRKSRSVFSFLLITILLSCSTLHFNNAASEEDINKKLLMYQTTLDYYLYLFAEEGTQPAIWKYIDFDEQERIALYNVSTTNRITGNTYEFSVFVVFTVDMFIQEDLASCCYDWKSFEYSDIFTMLAIFDSALKTLARDSTHDDLDDAFNVILDMLSGEYQQNSFVFTSDYCNCSFAYSLNIEHDDSVTCDLYIMYSII